jgi:hypothetical protein
MPDSALPPSRHRLVITEGIMGSGKTTTTRFLAKRLQDDKRRALAVHEGTDPHPVRATDDLEHWFQPWLDTTPARLAQRSIEKWTVFVETMQADATVPVVDGQLFHGDLTNLFLMEAEVSDIAGYVQTLAKVIAPLNPFVLYFRQEDVAQAIRVVCAERGAKWQDYQIDWKLAAPYCVRRKLSGIEGLIDLYRDYRRLTDQLFDELPLAKLAIENGGRDWPRYQAQILRALALE